MDNGDRNIYKVYNEKMTTYSDSTPRKILFKLVDHSVTLNNKTKIKNINLTNTCRISSYKGI